MAAARDLRGPRAMPRTPPARPASWPTSPHMSSARLPMRSGRLGPPRRKATLTTRGDGNAGGSNGYPGDPRACRRRPADPQRPLLVGLRLLRCVAKRAPPGAQGTAGLAETLPAHTPPLVAMRGPGVFVRVARGTGAARKGTRRMGVRSITPHRSSCGHRARRRPPRSGHNDTRGPRRGYMSVGKRPPEPRLATRPSRSTRSCPRS